MVCMILHTERLLLCTLLQEQEALVQELRQEISTLQDKCQKAEVSLARLASRAIARAARCW